MTHRAIIVLVPALAVSAAAFLPARTQAQRALKMSTADKGEESKQKATKLPIPRVTLK